jgi:hypothetical protein
MGVEFGGVRPDDRVEAAEADLAVDLDITMVADIPPSVAARARRELAGGVVSGFGQHVKRPHDLEFLMHDAARLAVVSPRRVLHEKVDASHGGTTSGAALPA